MNIDPILQTLGQSLDHWQALYIVSITISLLSTFAIIFFAFHKEHRGGLKTSNWIYGVASLFAVLSTIVIVNKTKSLDQEKDRVLKRDSDAVRLQTAQAIRDAADASITAGIASQKADTAGATASAAAIKAATLEQASSLREITGSQKETVRQSIALFLKQNPETGKRVPIYVQATDYDTWRYSGKVRETIVDAGLEPSTLMWYPGMVSTGVGIIFRKGIVAPPLASAIHAAFDKANIPNVMVDLPLDPRLEFMIAVGMKRTPNGDVPTRIVP